MADSPELDLSVVIPVFRSAETLRELLARLLPVLEKTKLQHEVILVDDGSEDESWRVLLELASTHPERVTAIQLMRNYGQHNALMCGFRHSRGRYIVTMDDDLQHPPEEIPKLLDTLVARDLDLVYGCYEEKNHTAMRNLGSALINSFFRLVFRLNITVTSFRVIRRELLESIYAYTLNFTFVDGLLAWNTRRVGTVAVAHQRRSKGRSGYSLAKLTGLALNLFTNFSLLPLQLVSFLGLAMSGVGFVTALYYLVKSFQSYIDVPGYASTIIAVLVLGGMQLLALGVLGEYVGRLHLNVNRKPQYVVRSTTGAGPAAQGRVAGHDDDSTTARAA